MVHSEINLKAERSDHCLTQRDYRSNQILFPPTNGCTFTMSNLENDEIFLRTCSGL